MSLVDTREVVDLKVNSKNVEWIALSWESPCTNNINISIIYRIKRCDEMSKNCKETNETVTWHNATDLDPCTLYTFNVAIITSSWESEGITLSETTDHDSRSTIAACIFNIIIKIQAKNPINILDILISSFFSVSEIGDVRYLSVHNVSVNTVQLSWQPPEVHEKCVSNYSIIQCDKKSCKNITSLATNYTVNDLDPCTQYYFTVKTVAQTVQSAGVNETAKTTSPRKLAYCFPCEKFA